MKAQYNFKIEDNLKDELNQLQEQSGVAGKEEFLQELLNSYKHMKVNQVDTEIDLSKYETVSSQSKVIVSDAFKHILATMESNSTHSKQQALLLEQDKLSIAAESESFNLQLEQLTSVHNQKLLDIDKAAKEQLSLKDEEITLLKSNVKAIQDTKDILDTKISDLSKELTQVQTIAEQVQIISTENKLLRSEQSKLVAAHEQKVSDIDKVAQEQISLKEEEIKSSRKDIEQLEDSIKDLKQTKFKNELMLSNKDQEIEQSKQQLSELTNKDQIIKDLEKQNTILETKLEIYNKD